MESSYQNAGVVVDERLAPAGLTRVLGSYGNARATMLALAAVVFFGAMGALLLAPSPKVSLVFVVPIVLVAAEIGTRASVLCALLIVALLIAIPSSGWVDAGPATMVARALSMLFLALVVGRLSDRAAKSRRMLEQVLEATPDSIYLKDLDGRYLLVNSAAARLIGRPGREILGHTNAELLPEVAAEIAGHDADVIARDEPDAYEITGSFGEQRCTLSVTKSPFHDATGATIGALGIARDISVQRRLQAESTRFFDLSGDMLCTVDFDGYLRRVNGEWTKTLGWSEAELVGRHASELMDREDHDLMGQASRAVTAKDAAGAHVTTRWHHKDGSLRWIDWTLRTVVDEGLIYASGRDMTERRHDIVERREREREIGEAQERFRRAFEDAPIGMAVANLDGTYLEVNQALCAITGYSADALCGVHFSTITHADDVAGQLTEIKALLDGKLSTSLTEKRYLRADGGVVWVTRTSTLVRDTTGVPLHFLDQVQDVTERRRFEGELRHLADHDPLTGLLNRRRFGQELDRQVSDVARYGPHGALLVLDLDHFKYVNDALGHHAGDELILSVAATLRGRLRESDILARLGGDEFAVLLPNVDEAGAKRVAGDLVRAIRDEAAIGSASGKRRVTTSVGVAPFRAGDETGEELLIAADLAMYDAKEAGRDRFAIVSRDAEKPDRVRVRVSWLQRIRGALADDRFVLHAQPIRNLSTGEIGHHELLLRMLGHDGELIGPGAFLPLAERFGLTPEIDRWVTTRAIELLAADPGGQRALEVNLSGPSLNDTALLHLVEHELAQRHVDPRRLIFEVTETAAVANIPLARRFAERLMALGCRFALDDFGAGFGSFYYLKHLPFDYLKIDGEFVSGCLANKTDQLVIEAVVRIARGLGKETIAEFVETAELETFLRAQGIDYAQGFHIGRPVSISEPRWRERALV